MIPEPVSRLLDIYQKLSADNLDLLAQVYSDDIVFTDPAHRLEGLDQLRAYFANLYANVNHIDFEFGDTDMFEGKGYIKWKMTLIHPRLNSGNTVVVDGLTYVEFSEKITFHKDYFDLGSMVYENIPVVGGVVRYIKRQLSND